MALNTWWDGDPGQRYWMQITDREDLGGPLLAPKLAELRWGYDLVSQVQPGDRVLHWWTRGGTSGLVGWSEVEEHATVIPSYTWSPRHGEERTTTGWCAALGPVHWFPSRVTSADLLPILDQIVAVDEALGATHNGTIYFPITRYGANRPAHQQEVRAAQAYFVKFPVELFDVIPGIESACMEAAPDPFEVEVVEDFQQPGKKAPSGRTARTQDPALRAAIERRSLDVAKEYYERLDSSEYVEVGRPYDIRVTVDGRVRRCEVKGSSLEIDTVELTSGEVDHNGAYTPMDLIVVDKIEPIRNPATGEVTDAIGGRRRVWVDWSPARDDLMPTKYAYRLPGGASTPSAG